MIENAIKEDPSLIKRYRANFIAKDNLGELKKSLESSNRDHIEELTKQLNESSSVLCSQTYGSIDP